MTLKAKRAMWNRRLKYRHGKHVSYHDKKKHKGLSEARRKELATKWHKLEAEAQFRVDELDKKIKAKQKKKTPAEKAVAWAKSLSKRRIVEKPAGSNKGPYITAWQRACADGGSWLIGQAWCGVFCWRLLKHAGVKGITSRMASVALIEDDARAGRYGFRAWTRDKSKVKPGDLVVLFGRGVHVEFIVKVRKDGVDTVGGNTSSGPGGSQSNGGGVFPRFRPNSEIYGFALVRY